MGTPHNHAEIGDIAEKVLLPGDPMRAKFIAENFLEDAVCYNEVRGMYGFTGLYKGEKVSIQGTGMGMPSMHIYASELIQNYGAKKLIRIGTCGSLREGISAYPAGYSSIESTIYGARRCHRFVDEGAVALYVSLSERNYGGRDDGQ